MKINFNPNYASGVFNSSPAINGTSSKRGNHANSHSLRGLGGGFFHFLSLNTSNAESGFNKILLLFFAVLSLTILTSCEDCKFDGIAPDDIPIGKVGADYSTVFKERATACSPSRVNIWLENGSLPPGLTLYPNGELRGKISANAEVKVYNFTITMEVCFSGSNSSGFTNCTTLSKGYALKVDPE